MTSRITLHPGDNRESLRRLIDQGVRVHSVITDPPYGLTSIVKRFGKEGAAPAKHGTDGAFSRASGGFMGKVWDGTGIERDPEFWRLIWEILLPGGFVFAFSGSRTGHWQACAMETAGFIMHPMHGWVYGSGFPKAHAADKAIDKMGGAERLLSLNSGWRDLAAHIREKRKSSGMTISELATHFPEFRAVSANWERSDAGNRVPNEAAYDRLIALIGIDDLWRDLVRNEDLRHAIKGSSTDRRGDNTVYGLGHSGAAYASQSEAAKHWAGWGYGTQSQKPALEPIYLAQKPYSEKTGAANLLKHGVGAVNIDACRVPAERPAQTYSQPDIRGGQYNAEREKRRTATVEANLGRWPANLLHDGSEAVIDLFPDSKGQQGAIVGTEPSRTGDENTHCYGKYGARPPTPVRGDEGSTARFFHGFTLTDEDYAWAIAAGLIDDVPALLEPIRYQGKAKKSDRAGSKHPTVKPIALMEYCITHLTPKGGTVLDPFAGSGTTGEAARRLGFDCILMEAEPDYVDFLRQRFDLPGEIEDLLAAEIEDLLAEPKSPNDETSIVYPHIVGTLDSDIMSLLS